MDRTGPQADEDRGAGHGAEASRAVDEKGRVGPGCGVETDRSAATGSGRTFTQPGGKLAAKSGERSRSLAQRGSGSNRRAPERTGDSDCGRYSKGSSGTNPAERGDRQDRRAICGNDNSETRRGLRQV